MLNTASPALNGTLASQAQAYLATGLSTLPAIRDTQGKRVALPSWKAFQKCLPTKENLQEWFDHGQSAMCIVCGAVSGNLEMIDFDLGGEAFEPWRESVEATCPGLLSRLVIESTPSGGQHVVYRCSGRVAGNTKLASKRIETDGPEGIAVGGKPYKPRKNASGRWHIIVTLIETRGEGGMFLCAPSAGYQVFQGDLLDLPVITPDERDILLGCAAALDQDSRPVLGRMVVSSSPRSDHDRPGDDFNARGDVRGVLAKHGWLKVRSGENEHWCRPGKEQGTSATLKDGVFFVFSSNAPPFEPQKGYAPFAVYTLLEHDGDWSAAARHLRDQGYGDDPRNPTSSGLAPTPKAPRLDVLVPSFMSAASLSEKHQRLRDPVIDNLLRRGETMNVIAAPKTGKSWLALDMVLAVSSERPWLGRYATTSGDVLLLDNELHPETLASRIPLVARARNLDFASVGQHVFVESLRGKLQDIFSLGSYFARVEPGRFKLIVLDAFYRFLPVGHDENDNATMANIYNAIDSYTDQLGCGFVLIHHSTKGNQSSKSVTDVGAGAGSQSRAADTHLVLRPHEEADCVVLEAAARSWAPVQPIGLRWDYPIWHADPDLDPSQLRQERPGKRKQEKPPPNPALEWDVDRFVATLLSDKPVTMDVLRAYSSKHGLSGRESRRLLALAEERGCVKRVALPGRGGPMGYVRVAKESKS